MRLLGNKMARYSTTSSASASRFGGTVASIAGEFSLAPQEFRPRIRPEGHQYLMVNVTSEFGCLG
ncbi:MAG: hypothetical protein WBW06_06930 [Xanthobacteraceae bacterium]|jgi:hypothetical protein